MPFSEIVIGEKSVEIRDSQLMDFVEFLESIVTRFLASRRTNPESDWLNLALKEWREECELPPGCKTIDLKKWLDNSDRRRLFTDLLDFMVELLEKRTPPAPLLLAEIHNLKNVLIEPLT